MKANILIDKHMLFLGIEGGRYKYSDRKKEMWLKLGIFPYISIVFRWGLKKK